ncbi:Glycosyltransferase family 2 [Cedratvirus Zaza IHUMI]|uniref:Glycosyltransferase family 2 n=1 Tax=Cedratvirus Zaza IHUMI TaxID=2126979 RepID=A0A2R8FFX7_9VIRU|nr:Glycosyltransferase family 2 [Cedratvirus Zaza IHUMI]
MDLESEPGSCKSEQISPLPERVVRSPPDLLASHSSSEPEDITIAILAKDKAHCLDIYLSCIEKQTWPKKNTNLYIRTNNNNDDTEEVLSTWLQKHGTEYKQVFFDASDVQERVQCYTPHEWNGLRFSVLGKIRQDSVNWALAQNSHYFVVDCDNFILPHTLETLHSLEKGVVGPLLRGQGCYANYHYNITPDGYCADSGQGNYLDILHGSHKGVIEVPVIHCTYFIRKEHLKDIVYVDGSGRHEYVIFSANLRNKGIKQYLTNETYFGYLTFADSRTELLQDERIRDFLSTDEKSLV